MGDNAERVSRGDATPSRGSRRRARCGGRTATARILSLIIAALVGVAFAAACGKPRTLTAADRGEVIYRTNCTSCHNRDPNLPGPLGPAIAGAPRSLIEARVLHGTYPPGYHPQRKSHTMRALPWLDGHIDDLSAYLTAVSHNSG
jgi:mono/diheme cytochrome c family protein